MRILTALPFLSLAAAHTVFTTLYVDGENQGDGVCVRMNQDPAKVNFPVEPLSSKNIACGTVFETRWMQLVLIKQATMVKKASPACALRKPRRP